MSRVKWNRVAAAAVLSVLLLTGTAFADYQSDQDITVSVELLPGTLQTSGSTGSTTFELQEGVHQTITSTTGTSVDHSYIWVNLNGTSLLAVDPFCVYSGR